MFFQNILPFICLNVLLTHSTLNKLCNDYLVKYASIKGLISNNGTQYKQWAETMKRLGTKHYF